MTGTTNKTSETNTRPLGNTEHNWCHAVSSGTGITVLALEISKTASQTQLTLQNILKKLQQSHPLLRCKLHFNPTSRSFTFLTSSNPSVHVTLHEETPFENTNAPPNAILERELNNNDAWVDFDAFPSGGGADVLFADVYAVSKAECVAVLRLHPSVCDRTTAVSLLNEVMDMVSAGTWPAGLENGEEGKMGIESLVPSGAGNKTLWAHGMDMLGYSVGSLRLTNLNFASNKGPRSSEVLRLKVDEQTTARILQGCKSREIKLCGALSAAALIATHSTKNVSDLNKQQLMKKKYGIVTLTDCRSILEPSLSTHQFGFYHSAILNTHTVKGTENFWDMAKTCYSEFSRYKNRNRHFTDMADLNFLMKKAIENPNLTPSSSLRSSLVAVFEDPVIDNSRSVQKKIGVKDYIGCASVHGIGPSIGIFDTIRDGELDIVFVYPSPLHSRKQMSELVDHMKKILVNSD